MGSLNWLKKFFLEHTRVVKSGSFPLYRLMAIGSMVAGILQLVFGHVPESTQQAANSVPAERLFSTILMIGGALIILALYIEPASINDEGEVVGDRLHLSLSVETVGIALLAASLIQHYVGSISKFGVPVSQASWLGLMFLAYILAQRLVEIRRAIKRLRG